MDNTFPLDYYEFLSQWRRWLYRYRTYFARTSYQFPDKNFLADDVLGVWRINGKTVELSEVVFCLHSTSQRAIVITYGSSSGHHAGPVVYNFSELEKELGLAQ